jgi:hypothetical protein
VLKTVFNANLVKIPREAVNFNAYTFGPISKTFNFDSELTRRFKGGLVGAPE